MSDTIPLQATTVYGPIRSRRLGCSLGINVLPVGHKVCSSNCVYCQYGWTLPEHSTERLKRAPELLDEMEDAFRQYRREETAVDCITLAGNGEPTLHPDLGDLVTGLRRLRDTYFPTAAVGILSDSTQVMRPKVRAALERLDVRYMKFDAAEETMWRQINGPFGNTSFREMLEGLKTLPDIVLQSMFMQGAYDNTGSSHLGVWYEVVGAIRPRSVQVYTIDRGTAAPGIIEVSREDLQRIADRLTALTGIPADIFD